MFGTDCIFRPIFMASILIEIICMRRYGLIVLFVMITGGVSGLRAQQDPQFTQYMFNQLFYNPGFAGVEGASKFTMLHRTQWAGYQSSFASDDGGAPSTTTINFSTPIYKFQSGFGGEITNDNLGPLNNLGVSAIYAYHLDLKGKKLSLGVRFGVISQSINFDQYRWANPDDPYRLEGKETQIRPDLSMGLYYRAEKYFAGISINHLLDTQFDFGLDDLRNGLENSLYIMGGYDYSVSYNLVITPSVLLKSDFKEYSFDISAIATYNDKMWGGISFRQAEAAIVILGYSLMKDNSLKFGYSFDYIIQNQEAKQPTSHEIMLNYVMPVSPFGGRKVIRTPRFRH